MLQAELGNSPCEIVPSTGGLAPSISLKFGFSSYGLKATDLYISGINSIPGLKGSLEQLLRITSAETVNVIPLNKLLLNIFIFY
jgi:hypothetical protein